MSNPATLLTSSIIDSFLLAKENSPRATDKTLGSSSLSNESEPNFLQQALITGDNLLAAGTGFSFFKLFSSNPKASHQELMDSETYCFFGTTDVASCIGYSVCTVNLLISALVFTHIFTDGALLKRLGLQRPEAPLRQGQNPSEGKASRGSSLEAETSSERLARWERQLGEVINNAKAERDEDKDSTQGPDDEGPKDPPPGGGGGAAAKKASSPTVNVRKPVGTQRGSSPTVEVGTREGPDKPQQHLNPTKLFYSQLNRLGNTGLSYFLKGIEFWDSASKSNLAIAEKTSGDYGSVSDAVSTYGILIFVSKISNPQAAGAEAASVILGIESVFKASQERLEQMLHPRDDVIY